MNALLITRILRNGFWLVLALGCIAATEQFFRAAQALTLHEAIILGIVILCSALLIETLSTHDERNTPLFRQNLAIILATGAIVYLLHAKGYVTVQTPSILAVLILFALLRCISGILLGHWHFPSWLSTKVMLLGNGPTGQKIMELIENSNGRYTLTEVLPLQNGDDAAKCSEALKGVTKSKVCALVVSLHERRGTMPLESILRCRMTGVEVFDAQTFYEKLSRKLFIENLTPSHFIFAPWLSLSIPRRITRRFEDVLAATIGLVLLAPLFPIIGLFLYLDSPGPIFFRQVRTGRWDRPFKIIKFRTMRPDAEKETGAVWATERDPRITRVGAFLRKTRLDEIPQLINVLLGDMSLVGPRPERPEFIKELEKEIPFYSERHSLKPGVTGWAQVRYPYGSSVEDALEKLRYDLYYIKNQSILLDMEIVLRTILVVFSGKGAR